MPVPPRTPIIKSVMNNNYANDIVKALEEKGESKDYIIGFLTATINGLRYIDNQEVNKYLKRSVEQALS